MSITTTYSLGSTVIETYRYEPGPPGFIPPHHHDQWSLCLSLDFPGRIRHGGETHSVPVGSLLLVAPGEVHAEWDPHSRTTASHFTVAYLEAVEVAAAVAELDGGGWPRTQAHGDPVFFDSRLAGRLGALYPRRPVAPGLEGDVAGVELISDLVGQRARSQVRASKPPTRAIALMRQYLADQPERNVRLDEFGGPDRAQQISHGPNLPRRGGHDSARIPRGRSGHARQGRTAARPACRRGRPSVRVRRSVALHAPLRAHRWHQPFRLLATGHCPGRIALLAPARCCHHERTSMRHVTTSTVTKTNSQPNANQPSSGGS